MQVNKKDSDEQYDRRTKEADEIFCTSCGAIIKAEAEICPKCGVKNKSKVVSDVENNRTDIATGVKPEGSGLVFIMWLILCWPIAIIYYCIRRW